MASSRLNIGHLRPVGVVLAALVLAWWVVATGGAFYLRELAPEIAVQLNPADARANAVLADNALQPGASRAQIARAAAYAKAALRRDPNVAPAARILSAIDDLEGRRPDADRAIRYSEFLSRRDLQTQLALAERAVQRNDVPTVLRHYDIALRTTAIAPTILMPILVNAVDDPELVEGITRTVANRPVWARDFLVATGQGAPNLRAAAALFRRVARSQPLPPDATEALIRRLVDVKDYEAAWAIYGTMFPDASRSAFASGDFTSVGTGPLGWTLTNASSLTAEAQPPTASEPGSLYVRVGGGEGGTLASRLLLLRAGQYELRASLLSMSAADRPMPAWSLTCVDGRVLGSFAMTRASTGRTTVKGQLAVPADCPAQTLVLSIPTAFGSSEISGEVGAVYVRPIDAKPL